MHRALAAVAVLVGLISITQPGQAAEEAYAAQKIVYHNNGRGKDSGPYFKALLKNIKNNIEAVGKERADVKVVSHGDGLRVFEQAQHDKGTAENLDDLRGKGVQFLVCKNTLAERKIHWRTLYGVKESDLVTSGVAELVKLQQAGYAYIHP